MLGDIVPNNGNNTNVEKTADAPKPGSYGMASFGVTRPRTDADQPPHQQQPGQQPVAGPIQADMAVDPADEPLSKQSGSKVPLVLMVIGVLVFVGGVSGLFVYALSGA